MKKVTIATKESSKNTLLFVLKRLYLKQKLGEPQFLFLLSFKKIFPVLRVAMNPLQIIFLKLCREFDINC